MKISIVGGGYVGLVSSVCFADLGNDVTCIENNLEKYQSLNNGNIPFYEPELLEKFRKNIEKKRLLIKSEIDLEIFNSDFIFLAVGTPMSESGEANLDYLFQALESICALAKNHAFSTKIILTTKSTVPVGTGQKLMDIIEANGLANFIIVASNPEFLREGSAVHDFFHPDRVVIGCSDKDTFEQFERLYSPICRNSRPLVQVSVETAELTKYAANTFLATKISFINEMARICDHVGADISDVAKLMGLDGRIGKYFLNPSPGYGGSCFPKDTHALYHFAKSNGLTVNVVKAGIDANTSQVDYCFQKCEQLIGELNQSITVAILGCSFKPNTDDIRDSSSIKIIHKLLETGCKIRVTDPEALNNVKHEFGDKINYFDTSYEAAESADAVLLMTEWHDYRHLDLTRLASGMKQKIFLDYRLLYSEKELSSAGFKCYVLGKYDPTNIYTTIGNKL